MSHPDHRSHACTHRGGVELDSAPSDHCRPQNASLSWPVEHSVFEDLELSTYLDVILAEFTSRWERGEAPSIPEFLTRLGPSRVSDSAALIYHAYRLAQAAGLDP